jgi:hypothetical protein
MSSIADVRSRNCTEKPEEPCATTAQSRFLNAGGVSGSMGLMGLMRSKPTHAAAQILKG